VLGRTPLVRRRRLETPRMALDAGVAMIPESRRDQGLLPGRPVRENVSLTSLRDYSTAGLVAGGAERRAVDRMLTQLEVRTAGQGAPAITLSGGNQQKLLFARMLLRSPKVLIADEPTRGVDVGAKRAIYEILASLAAEGMAILLISSDVEELIGLAHRVLVMRAGKLVAGLAGEQITEEAILSAAFGTAERGAS